MYAEIAANRRKTAVLIIVFMAVILAVGYAFGAANGDATAGFVFAFIISAVSALFGYYQGDSVALWTSGAKQIEKSQAPELWNLVENLSITAGIPMPALYVINDDSPNAFATGRDPKHASVAVTTGLLRRLDRIELEGVLAHEMSHVKNEDIRVMTIVIVLVGTITLVSDWLMRSFLFGGDRRERSNGEAGMVLFIGGLILAIVSPLIAQLIKLAVSRSREYLADASGALLTRHPEGLARALEKIATTDAPLKKASNATAHLYIANPFDPHEDRKQWLTSLFSTHPPIEDRIKRLRTMGR